MTATVPPAPADDRPVEFLDDGPDELSRADRSIWRVLVVDDDEDVHTATVFALEYTEVLGRMVQLLHAYSAAQARDILQRERDIAVVLLDVVMETADAGLQLVPFIRQQLGMHATRIILRTGQPGYAPEQQTLERYDINDYKSKSELTRPRLLAAITSAVRSYQQIRSIETHRLGLQRIIDASADLLERRGLQAFADGVLTQLAALLDVDPEGLVCAHHPDDGQPCLILAAAGMYAHLIGQPLEALRGHPSTQHLLEALRQRRSLFLPQETVLFVAGDDQVDMAVYLPMAHHLDPDTQRLIDVFCLNLSAYLRNLNLIERLRELAYHDPRVGAHNRTWLEQKLQDLIARGQASAHALALLDIDRFSGINECMGAEFGDDVLRALAARLHEFARSAPQAHEAMEVARVGSDTLAVLGPSPCTWLQALRQAVQRPLQVRQQPFKIQTTMAWCEGHDFGRSGADTLRNAATALKTAKTHHRGSALRYDPAMSHDTRQRTQLLEQLHHALADGELYLAYQPQLALDGRRLVGAEALLRWRHPQGLAVGPDQFIPLAEQSGLIEAIGSWVIQRACRDWAWLQAQGCPLPRVAINLSPIQLRRPALVDEVADALQQHGMPAQALELEITETVGLPDHLQTLPVLQALRKLGLSIVIDDFGTGYSNLQRLQELPIDGLKIDRSFIQRMLQSRSCERIVETIVQLADHLQLRVTAEGIEDEAVLARLQTMGCHEGQGWAIARPMPAADLHAWCAEHITRQARSAN
ncbi:putative bifunctional diguanylate cyclase/phosphodiesterase [Tepidimonas alkaliphilus]|nr:EAL domain-containing protein [Tepidimonas alkaliphilus]